MPKTIKFRTSHWGKLSQIAKRLGFSRSYVSMVAAGQRRNPKIARALAKETRRAAA